MSEKQTPSAKRFARYRPTDRTVSGRRFWVVPEGGVCLSAFLVLRPPSTPGRVLLGTPSPQAPWEQMATLERAHLDSIGTRRILPASHLLEFESPSDAAERILAQQLEIPGLSLQGPAVFSEAYPSAIDPESGTHWDLHFVFQGEWPTDEPPTTLAWRRLEFVDPLTLTRADIARGHADILSLVGVPVGKPSLG
jgi:hypothetical protein